MKGPQGRLQTDCRRIWKCPACGTERLLPGTVTSVVCQCSGHQDSFRGSSHPGISGQGGGGQGSTGRGDSARGNQDSPQWMVLQETQLRVLRPIVQFDPHAPRGPQFLEDADPNRVSQPGVVQPRTIPKGPKPPFQGSGIQGPGASSRQLPTNVASQATEFQRDATQPRPRDEADFRETVRGDRAQSAQGLRPTSSASSEKRTVDARSFRKNRDSAGGQTAGVQEFLERDSSDVLEPQPAIPPDVPAETNRGSAVQEAGRSSPKREHGPSTKAGAVAAPDSTDEFAAGLDLIDVQTSSQISQSRPQRPTHQPADQRKRPEARPAKIPQPDDDAFGEGLIS